MSHDKAEDADFYFCRGWAYSHKGGDDAAVRDFGKAKPLSNEQVENVLGFLTMSLMD